MMCEYFDLCFYVQHMLETENGITGFILKSYCESDNNKCARYFLYKRVEPELVPDYLWPIEDMEAKSVLENIFRA